MEADPEQVAKANVAGQAFATVTGVCALYASIREMPVDPNDFLAVRARGAVEKRAREYAAGRALARTALRQSGLGEGVVAAAPERYPLWPAGVVGSISHSNRLVAVAVAGSAGHRGIGIDVEEECAVPGSVVDSVLSPREKKLVGKDAGNAEATRIFSCKEALYKAVYPRTHEFLDFLDVEIRIANGRFFADCVPGKRAAELIRTGRGFIEHRSEHVMALFVV